MKCMEEFAQSKERRMGGIGRVSGSVVGGGVFNATLSGSEPTLMEDAHGEVIDDIENYTVLER